MKLLFALVIAFLGAGFAFAQNEQSPIVEKEIAYKNWSYKNIKSDGETNLRDFATGKKLVMVVYFAPWCGNWKHDAPIVERFYEKYKANGLEVIAVGEYDPRDAMKANFDTLKLTFPVVYESESRADRQKTSHYGYRNSTGDTRGWGSPWYIFLEPGKFEKTGDVLVKKTSLVNGELIEAEAEKFIREKLGLSAMAATAIAGDKAIEACPTEEKRPTLVKP